MLELAGRTVVVTAVVLGFFAALAVAAAAVLFGAVWVMSWLLRYGF